MKAGNFSINLKAPQDGLVVRLIVMNIKPFIKLHSLLEKDKIITLSFKLFRNNQAKKRMEMTNQ
jgi:hypothetical protein